MRDPHLLLVNEDIAERDLTACSFIFLAFIIFGALNLISRSSWREMYVFELKKVLNWCAVNSVEFKAKKRS